MSTAVYGYARVSTREQNEGRQLLALAQFPVPGANIYLDKMSGKDFCRPQYQRLLGRLRPGDLLVVKSIDRLGRNYEEILDQWRLITKGKLAHIVVLDMPLLDTRNPTGGLTGTFIADLVLQILSYVAETERELIRQRQAEGIRAARLSGVRFGRPPKPRPQEFTAVLARWRQGSLSSRQAAGELGVCQSTFLRWGREEDGLQPGEEDAAQPSPGMEKPRGM